MSVYVCVCVEYRVHFMALQHLIETKENQLEHFKFPLSTKPSCICLVSTSVPTDTFVHVSLFAYELNLSIAQLPLIALNMRSFCMVNIHITVCVSVC